MSVATTRSPSSRNRWAMQTQTAGTPGQKTTLSDMDLTSRCLVGYRNSIAETEGGLKPRKTPIRRQFRRGQNYKTGIALYWDRQWFSQPPWKYIDPANFPAQVAIHDHFPYPSVRCSCERREFQRHRCVAGQLTPFSLRTSSPSGVPPANDCLRYGLANEPAPPRPS